MGCCGRWFCLKCDNESMPYDTEIYSFRMYGAKALCNICLTKKLNNPLVLADLCEMTIDQRIKTVNRLGIGELIDNA